MINAFRDFLRLESASGIILVAAAVLAMTLSPPSGASAELGPITVIGVEAQPTVVEGDEIRLRLEMS